MAKITYLLGAGASANAIPTIAENKKELWFKILYTFQEIIGETYKKNGINNGYPFDIPLWRKYFEKVGRHYTIDTYSKKCSFNYHGEEDVHEYIKSKFFNSLSILAHEIQGRGEDEVNGVLNINNIFFRKDWYKSHVDYRYDSFLAALLDKKDKHLVLPPDINIISWNYDMQLEIAYSNYCEELERKNLSYIQEQLKIFPKIADYRNKGVSPLNADNAQIIRLNGTAFIEEKNAAEDVNIDKYFSLENIMKLHHEFYTDNDKFLKGHNCYLNYSWEDENINRLALQRACKIIEESDIIVVIGYSFPLFNNKTDKELFKKFERTVINKYGSVRSIQKPIVIQDIDAGNTAVVKHSLNTIFIGLSEIAQTYSSPFQFYLPPEYLADGALRVSTGFLP